jgi:imidazoleglycerol-phosphate dehydratase
MVRTGAVERITAETKVYTEVTIDGTGRGDISCGVPFFEHMLKLFCRHGLFDLRISASGDREIDDHHLVEDIGITLGLAFRQAWGEKAGIERYGQCLLPMDESLCQVAVDLSGRPYLVYQALFPDNRAGNFSLDLLREFFKAFSDQASMTLHINVLYGTNPHHVAEGIFKATARALRESLRINDRITGVLSTKGSL